MGSRLRGKDGAVVEQSLMRFAIVVHKDKGSSYGVTVPDLPGCISGGDTLDEAFVSVQEAILLHLEGILDEGEPLPETSLMQKHQTNEDFRDGIWGFVDVDLADISGKAAQVNITVPSRMLDTIDAWARREGESRSGFLLKAALEYIGDRA